jgi:ADP-heptose:LPS heptosyltransferase
MKVKFLVIRFSSIGDIVLTTPVVRGLKQQVEEAEVHFVTKEKHAPLLFGNPNIDKVHILHEKITPLLDELQQENFDYIIDLHRNIRSGQIKRRLKVPSFTFDKLNIKKWMLVNFKINKMPDSHVVDRYMAVLSVFDVQNDSLGLDFYIREDEEYPADHLPVGYSGGFVAIVIGGTYYTKRLPAQKVAEICTKISHPVVLLGGDKEFETGEEIMKMVSGNVVNLCGKLSIHQSASLIRQARVVLTNDTGLMHIAAAFKKKILSFWGNTVPAFGMVPYLPDPVSVMLQVDSLNCRPCSKLGYNKCPRKHFNCMNNIDTEMAADWVKANF